VVVVVASNLDSPEAYQSLSHFQWVDYRRQQRERLESMARDLLIAGPDRVTHSFSTRLAPQNFRKILLPRKTAFYIGTQFFFFNLGVAFYVRNLSTGTSLDFLGRAFGWTDALLLLLGVVGIFYSLWLGNRIIRREIGTESLLNRLTVFTILNYSVGFIIGLMIPLPPGYVRDWGRVFVFVIPMAIGIGLGYLIGRVYLNWILKDWLPVGYSPEAHPFPGFRQDWPLWRRNFISALLVGLFTFSFLGGEIVLATPDVTAESAQYGRVNIDGKLTLEIPQQWFQFNGVAETEVKLFTRSIPVSAALQRASGPLNTEIAGFLNGLFSSRAVGDLMFSNVIRRMRDNSQMNWNALGEQRFVAVYGSSASQDDLLVLGVWQFDPTAESGFSTASDLGRDGAIRGTESNELVAHDPLVLRYDVRRAGGGLVDWVSIYDTPVDDYIVVVTGNRNLIADQEAVIERVIQSAQFELPPGLTLTPTPTITPTETPTPMPTRTPTPAPREPMMLEFDGISFRELEGWNAALVDNNDLYALEWSMPGINTYNSVFNMQNWLFRNEDAVRGEWTAFPGDFIFGGYPLMVFARFIGEEDVEDWIERTISLYGASAASTADTLANGLQRWIISYIDINGYLTTEWYVHVDTPNADYVFWIYGYELEVDTYAVELMAWLRSFR
jgi:hypothetical protein